MKSRRHNATGKKEDMDIDIDHYIVLGLPSGEKGSKLSEKEITKAYRQKAKELHPDKQPDDPNAASNFQKLQTSYEILKHENTRKPFDDLLRVKQKKIQPQTQPDPKRSQMRSDLKERERNGSSQDPNTKARNEDERISRILEEEIHWYREMQAKKMGFNESEESSRKKAKTGREKSNEPVKSSNETRLNEKLVGVGYQAFEDSVLQKLEKAAERQKARGGPHLIDKAEEENDNEEEDD